MNLHARRGRLFIIDGRGGSGHRWQAELADLDPRIVASPDDTPDLTAEDVVIVDPPALDGATLASIRASGRGSAAMRILTAEHHELAEILRTGANDGFRHVIPRACTATNVRALVTRLRAPGPDDGAGAAESSSRWSAVVELLRWTISEAVRVQGVVIRSYQPQTNKHEIQLVFRLGRGFEHFHCELPRRWRWPVRARAGEGFTNVEATLPAVQSFGRIERDQEIYVRPVEGSPDSAYLAILPWENDERVTIALGLWLEDGASASLQEDRASVMAGRKQSLASSAGTSGWFSSASSSTTRGTWTVPSPGAFPVSSTTRFFNFSGVRL